MRVLFAKDAISTGWDCPRAEVLVSFRPAEDETRITQLLGRMVRTPSLGAFRLQRVKTRGVAGEGAVVWGAVGSSPSRLLVVLLA